MWKLFTLFISVLRVTVVTHGPSTSSTSTSTRTVTRSTGVVVASSRHYYALRA